MKRVLMLLTLAIMLAVAGCVDREADDAQPTAEPATDDQEQVDYDAAADDDEPAVDPTPAPDDEATDDDATDDQPEPVEDVDYSQAVSSTSMFGFDMFTGLADADPDENVITSPYSAAILLTMLLAGADGDTRDAIGEVLHIEDPDDPEILRQHQALITELTEADEDVELAIANSLWANQGTPLEPEYLSEMEDYLGALVEEIDLGSEDAVDQIDEWVADNTNDRIEEMAEALGVPDPNMVLILLNAVYFLADWTEPFDPDMTDEEAIFTTVSGDEVTVSMMTKDDTHLHAQMDGYQMVRLPYGDDERFAMDVILPDEESDIHQLREGFDLEEWQQAEADLNEDRVNVAMPSFELEYDTGGALNEVLEDLGMGIAYTGEADFTPISELAPFLSTVVQKTYIRVDEEGTEAAAVTGGAMVESAPPQFRADRPFMIMITDTESGTVLFLGQVTDPSE
ncbi:MAG: serpin family protein [Sphaerobacteraceae bacterium]|nr:MAG: serpin family protein [Sphaerobacteraceae bacterium]